MFRFRFAVFLLRFARWTAPEAEVVKGAVAVRVSTFEQIEFFQGQCLICAAQGLAQSGITRNGKCRCNWPHFKKKKQHRHVFWCLQISLARKHFQSAFEHLNVLSSVFEALKFSFSL